MSNSTELRLLRQSAIKGRFIIYEEQTYNIANIDTGKTI